MNRSIFIRYLAGSIAVLLLWYRLFLDFFLISFLINVLLWSKLIFSENRQNSPRHIALDSS